MNERWQAIPDGLIREYGDMLRVVKFTVDGRQHVASYQPLVYTRLTLELLPSQPSPDLLDVLPGHGMLNWMGQVVKFLDGMPMTVPRAMMLDRQIARGLLLALDKSQREWTDGLQRRDARGEPPS